MACPIYVDVKTTYQSINPIALYRFKALQEPMAKRRKKLEDSLKWHQYNFDANSELQWVTEHMPAASSTDYGKNLVDAQNMHVKHKVR